jgi:hypothetical protein
MHSDDGLDVSGKGEWSMLISSREKVTSCEQSNHVWFPWDAARLARRACM